MPPGFPKVNAQYATDPLQNQNNENINNGTNNTNELNMPSIDVPMLQVSPIIILNADPVSNNLTAHRIWPSGPST